MNCRRVEQERIAERYVFGALEPELKEAFELHYFGCEECARQVQTWVAIAPALREAAPAIRREMPAAPSRARWIGGFAAIAAGIVVLAGVSLIPRESERAPATVASIHEVDLTQLAKLDPPAYEAPVLRGIETPAEQRFHEAMQAYLRRDYANAIAGLRDSLRLDPNAAAARFFLGASELMDGEQVAGVTDLQVVASGASPFAEEARFDLAKGYLMLGRREEALTTLRTLASSGGDFAAPARDLLQRLGQ